MSTRKGPGPATFWILAVLTALVPAGGARVWAQSSVTYQVDPAHD